MILFINSTSNIFESEMSGWMANQGTSRFLAQGGADAPPWLRQGGAFWSQGRASRFFTNNMIFLECGVIALFEAFYMFRDHNHVKMKF